MELRLLGGLEIMKDGLPVTGFVSTKAPALVAYLAVTGASQSREHLAGLLWSDAPEMDARASLRVVLSNLRQTLGAETLSITRTHVGLAGIEAIGSDLAEFLAATGETSTEGQAIEPLGRVDNLYGGDLLAGLIVRDAPLFEEWLVTERERIRLRAIGALESLAERRSASGDHAGAADALRQVLEIDPWYEVAFRMYMEQLALSGRRNAALVQFDTFSQLLERELGVAPEPETVELHTRIRNDEFRLASPASKPEPAPQPAARPTSRPVWRPANSFVGREEELELLGRYLRDPSVRLISLTGPGGTGKTRLALQAIEEHAGGLDFDVGVAMLADLDHPDQLLPAIAEAFGLKLDPAPDPMAQMQRRISNASAVLVLDNFEHLLDGVDQVSELVNALPGVTMLVTSRERLGLQSEWTIPVHGLPVDADVCESALSSSSVRLFIDRARQAQADFLPEADERRQIVEICRQVEGSPLGIELSASWMRLMDCTEIERRIRENLDFLSTSHRDVPERHRSLRAVFDGSWDMLDPVAREKFQALSVFPGGFTADAASEVAGTQLADLVNLMDKSLIRRDQSGRYSLHDVLLHYAGEKLAGDPGRWNRRTVACPGSMPGTWRRRNHICSARGRPKH